MSEGCFVLVSLIGSFFGAGLITLGLFNGPYWWFLLERWVYRKMGREHPWIEEEIGFRQKVLEWDGELKKRERVKAEKLERRLEGIKKILD